MDSSKVGYGEINVQLPDMWQNWRCSWVEPHTAGPADFNQDAITDRKPITHAALSQVGDTVCLADTSKNVLHKGFQTVWSSQPRGHLFWRRYCSKAQGNLITTESRNDHDRFSSMVIPGTRLFSVHHSTLLLISSWYALSLLVVSSANFTLEFSWWVGPSQWTERKCDCQSELSEVCFWGSPMSGGSVALKPRVFNLFRYHLHGRDCRECWGHQTALWCNCCSYSPGCLRGCF